MNGNDQSLYASLQHRKQLLPEVTFGLPVVSLLLLGLVWGLQLSELPGDVRGVAWMATCAMLMVNVLSPLGYHFRRTGRNHLADLCKQAA